MRLLKGWVDWLTTAFTSCRVSADSGSPLNPIEAFRGDVRVPVLSRITVSTMAIFSITAAFLRYSPHLPNTLRVLPRVKGVDMASAQGQAMINTEVKALKPMDRSEKLHTASDPKAINSTVSVNHLLVLFAKDSREWTLSFSKETSFQRLVR